MSVVTASAAKGMPELVTLVEVMAGQPFFRIDWRELVRIRDVVEARLNAEINQRQSPGGDAA